MKLIIWLCMTKVKTLIDIEKRLPDKIRNAIIKLQKNEFSYKKTAEDVGVTSATISRWYKKYGKIVLTTKPGDQIVHKRQIVRYHVRNPNNDTNLTEQEAYQKKLNYLKEDIVDKLTIAIEQIERLSIRDIELMAKTLTYIESVSGVKPNGQLADNSRQPIIQNNFLQLVVKKLQQKINDNETTDYTISGNSEEPAE